MIKVELSMSDDPPPQRRHSATAPLNTFGETLPTVARLLAALEAMLAAGVPRDAVVQQSWPQVYAHWSEPLSG